MPGVIFHRIIRHAGVDYEVELTALLDIHPPDPESGLSEKTCYVDDVDVTGIEPEPPDFPAAVQIGAELGDIWKLARQFVRDHKPEEWEEIKR